MKLSTEAFHELDQRRQVVGTLGRAGDFEDRIAARKGEDLGLRRRLVERRDDRVFASAFSDHKDFHSIRI